MGIKVMLIRQEERILMFLWMTSLWRLCVFLCVRQSVVSDSLQLHGLQPTRLLCPRNSPGKNTGVGCHFFLQGIFLMQEQNLGLLNCRQILYSLIHQASPTISIENSKESQKKKKKKIRNNK